MLTKSTKSFNNITEQMMKRTKGVNKVDEIS